MALIIVRVQPHLLPQKVFCQDMVGLWVALPCAVRQIIMSMHEQLASKYWKEEAALPVTRQSTVKEAPTIKRAATKLCSCTALISHEASLKFTLS